MIVHVELEHLFDLYDADHSGTIDVLEVANILKAAGLHFKTGDVQNVFREMDIDGECSNSYITLAVKIRTFMKKTNNDYPGTCITAVLKEPVLISIKLIGECPPPPPPPPYLKIKKTKVAQNCLKQILV